MRDGDDYNLDSLEVSVSVVDDSIDLIIEVRE